GLVDVDGSSTSQQFAEALTAMEAEGLIDLELLDDEEAARTALDSGEIGAAFIIPAGFGAAVDSGGTSGFEVLGNVNRPTIATIAHSIADTFAFSIDGVRLAAATAAESGGDIAAAVASVQSSPPAVVLQGTEAADRQLDLTTFFVAGMAIFFLFFTVQFGV